MVRPWITLIAATATVFAMPKVDAAEVARPDSADAMKVAASWLGALGRKDREAVVGLSGYPFHALGLESEQCKGEKTTRDEAGLRAVVECAISEIVREDTQPELGKPDLSVLDEHGLRKPGWRKQRKALRRLLREERLLWRMYEDEDEFLIVVIGVRQTSAGPKVSSVTYHIDMIAD
jgi:hypothetical protein